MKKRIKIRKIRPYFCTHCGIGLRGQQIPKDQQHMFGADYFSREIGIYDTDQDRTVRYRCPDCDYEWSRI